MLNTYYCPWGDVRSSAEYLETHSARCRVLNLPYTTPPQDVHKALRAATAEKRQEAEALVAKAVANLSLMFAWRPEGSEIHTADVFGQFRHGGMEHYAVYGGRGSAKSWGAADCIIEAASTGKERVAGAREYMARIKDSSKELLDKRVKSSKWANDWVSTEYELRNKVTGSVIFFIGLAGHNAESVGKSLEGVTILWCDEAQLLSQNSIDIMRPTVREANSRCLWTWNPGEDPSPVDLLFRVGVPPERSMIQCKLVEENEYLYRSRLASEMRSSFASDTEAKFRWIWRGGHNDNPEAAIITDIRIGDVNFEALPCKGMGPNVMDLGGMDFGYGGSDPSAVVKVYLILAEALPGYTPEAGYRPILYVANECVQQNVANHELYHMCQTAQVHTVFCDSAMPLMINALNASGHVLAIPAEKGPGSVVSGLRKIASCQVIVSPRCPVTYESLKGMRWETDKLTKKIKTPRKPVGNKHTPDAIRYALSEVEITSGTANDVVYV